MLRALTLVGACLLFGSGCGGAVTTAFIIQGSLTMAGARSADAENLATYEYVSAQEYLSKAKEAHSYGHYEQSLRFARLATERAQKARARALERKKLTLPPSLTDTPDPSARDPKAPAPEGTTSPQPAAGATGQTDGQAPTAPPPGATTPAPQDPAPVSRPPPVIIRTVPQPAPEGGRTP